MSFEEFTSGLKFTPDALKIMKAYHKRIASIDVKHSQKNTVYIGPTKQHLEWIDRQIQDRRVDESGELKYEWVDGAVEGAISKEILEIIEGDHLHEYMDDVHSLTIAGDEREVAGFRAKHDHLIAEGKGFYDIISRFPPKHLRVDNPWASEMKFPKRVSKKPAEAQDVPNEQGVQELIDLLNAEGTVESTRNALAVMLGANTAGRTSELEGANALTITWGDIFPDNVFQPSVQTRAAKKDADEDIPMELTLVDPAGVNVGYTPEQITEQLVRLKEAYRAIGKKVSNNNNLWMNAKGTKPVKLATVMKQIQNFVKKTKNWDKYKDPSNPTEDTLLDSGHFTFRSLRNFRYVQLARAGLDPRQISLYTGHSEKSREEMFKIYANALKKGENTSGSNALWAARVVPGAKEGVVQKEVVEALQDEEYDWLDNFYNDTVGVFKEAAEDAVNIASTVSDAASFAADQINQWHLQETGEDLSQEDENELGFLEILEVFAGLASVETAKKVLEKMMSGYRSNIGIPREWIEKAAEEAVKRHAEKLRLGNKPGVPFEGPRDREKVPAPLEKEKEVRRSVKEQFRRAFSPKSGGTGGTGGTSPSNITKYTPPEQRTSTPRHWMGKSIFKYMKGFSWEALSEAEEAFKKAQARTKMYQDKVYDSLKFVRGALLSLARLGMLSTAMAEAYNGIVNSGVAAAGATMAIPHFSKYMRSVYNPLLAIAAHNDGHVTKEELRHFLSTDDHDMKWLWQKFATKNVDLNKLFRTAFTSPSSVGIPYEGIEGGEIAVPLVNPVVADIASAWFTLNVNSLDNNSERVAWRTKNLLGGLLTQQVFEDVDSKSVALQMILGSFNAEMHKNNNELMNLVSEARDNIKVFKEVIERPEDFNVKYPDQILKTKLEREEEQAFKVADDERASSLKDARRKAALALFEDEYNIDTDIDSIYAGFPDEGDPGYADSREPVGVGETPESGGLHIQEMVGAPKQIHGVESEDMWFQDPVEDVEPSLEPTTLHPPSDIMEVGNFPFEAASDYSPAFETKIDLSDWRVRGKLRQDRQRAKITRLQPKPLDVEPEHPMDEAFAKGTPSEEYNAPRTHPGGFIDYGKYATGP